MPALAASRSVILSVACLTLGLACHPVRAAPAITVGGPFELVGPDETVVTERTYRGKWVLIYFGYTSCPNTCPTTLMEVADALRRLGREAANVQALFITVDPAHDTADVLRQYTASFGSGIIGLTGTSQQIEMVTSEFGAYYSPRRRGSGTDDDTIDHSMYIYVMDPQGRFLRAFDSGWTSDRIASALHNLVSRP